MKKGFILFALLALIVPSLCFGGPVLNKVDFETSPIVTASVTVATGAATGTSTATTTLGKGCTVIGVVPTSNQDQLIDSVAVAVLAPTISGVTLSGTDEVSITATAHGLSSGDRVYITGVVGTTELNGKWWSITKVDANTFTLDGTDSSDFTAYTSDGTATSEKGQVTVTLAGNATADNEFDIILFKSRW